MNAESLLKSSKTRNTSRSIIWGVVNKTASLILPFIVRTVIIHNLGIEYAGLSGLFTSILTVLNLAELGFHSAIVFGMYKPMAEDNYDRINAYLNYYKKCYRIIGSIILALGMLIIPLLPYLIKGSYPSSINLYYLYFIYLSNVTLSYYLFAYKTSVFSAAQRMDIISNISTIILIITYSTQIVLLLAFHNYYLYAIVLPVTTAVGSLITECVSRWMYPELHPEGDLTDSEKREIHSKLRGLLLQRIGGIVLSSVDTIVISTYFGLRTLGTYSNYYYIITAIFGFFSVLQHALIPSVGNSIQVDSREKNYEDFKLFHFLYILCDIFCTSCLLLLLQDFMRIWVGESMMLDMRLVVLMCIYFYTYKMSDICSVYKFASGMWEHWKGVPLIAAFFNLALNLILVRFIGLYGVVISTIISLVFIYLPFYCYPVFKYYFNSISFFWAFIWRQFCYFIAALVISILTFLLLNNIKASDLLFFLLKLTLVVCVTSVLIFAMVLGSEYGTRIITLTKKILKKR